MAKSNPRPFVVMKFGGTSVKDRASWETIAATAQRRLDDGERPVIVCSALAGVSNELETLIREPGDHEAVIERIHRAHERLTQDLGVSSGDHLGKELQALRRLALGVFLTGDVSPRVQARIMAFGELMLTKLGAAFLESQGLSTSWMDARRLLKAKKDARVGDLQRFTNATCCHGRDEEKAQWVAEADGDVVVTQGFIASGEGGDTVLLGRGGSDTSAAYLAAVLGARRCEIWTDVPGIFTANPYEIPNARLIKTLDYEEAQEITTSGARVLHPRSIAPLREAGIPLHVRCTHEPDMDGTVISGEPTEASAHVKCLSGKAGVLLVSMDAMDMWQQVGFLADAFTVFKNYGLSIDMVSTSETNVTVTLDTSIQALEDRTLEALTEDLSRICTVRTIGPCAIVNLVGRHIRTIMHELGPTMKVFEEKRIHLVSQASNDLNLSFVVDENEAQRLVKKLHGLLMERQPAGSMFGPSWRELFDEEKTPEKSRVWAWWTQRAEPLLEIAGQGTPAYVYDEETVGRRIRDLKSLEAVDRVLYAVKANWHPELLRRVYDAGFGFECVSVGELDHLWEVFEELDPERVLFTPNFAPRGEYEAAFERGVHVTLDNLYPLAAWPEVFKGRPVFVRLDPGKGRGHHKHVHTAGVHSKFGIPTSDLDELVERAGGNDTRIVGLHAHTGSGILQAGNWSETALFFSRLLERFPQAEVLDLGGGLGVVEKPGQIPLDVSAVGEKLSEVKEAYPEHRIWLEPGRFLAAEGGVLLARVTQVKGKGETRYVGVDVGMNTLIRPALYGAYHEIVNLSKLGRPRDTQANVVGFICESGDTFGHARRLADPQEGDILLIATAGAYGRTMSSHYNLRPPAREVFLGF